jgi:hypothetical protein
LINEPAEPSGEKLFPYYKRLRDAILKIDPIIFCSLKVIDMQLILISLQKFGIMWFIPITIMLSPGLFSGGDYPGIPATDISTRIPLNMISLKK